MDEKSLVEALKSAKITQEAVAKVLGISQPNVWRLYNGERTLKLDEAEKLKAAFGLIPDTPLIRVTAMPSDTNPYGGIFGGWLMSQMALAAGSLASRHSKGKAVVVAATDLSFPGAMEVGDELSVYATLEREGTTSMTIRATARGRERDGDREFDVASGIFTFVAVNPDNTKRSVSGE